MAETMTVAPETAAPADGAASGTATATQTTAPVETTQTQASGQNGAPASTPTPTAELPDDYVWEGDPDNLPKPLQTRAKGVLRYLTKQSQTLAEEKKLAEEYRTLKNDPTFNQFMQAKQAGTAPQAPAQPQAPLYTKEELEEAQINPEKLGTLIERITESRLQQAAQKVEGMLSGIQAKQNFVDRKQEIQDFAELNPDFWTLHDRGLIKPYLREIVDTGKGSLQDAYNEAKRVADLFRQEALQQSQARVQQKKAAFSSTPSPSSEPEIIWANSKQEATQIAFDNAVLGKKVQVKVKH